MSQEVVESKAPGASVLEEVLLALCSNKSAFSNNHFVFRQLFEPGEAMMLEKILKLGEDYSLLKRYINSTESKSLDEKENVGLYTLMFTEYLDQVLEPYYHDILLLEQDIIENPQTSLHYVWSKIHRHSELLCGLNTLVSEITHQNSKGCMILHHLQERLSTDVGLVRSAIEHIIEGMNEELFSQIANWLLYGELVDSYSEFFIHHNPVILISEESTPFEEYCINMDMLPSHISMSLAEKILNVGQMVLFLRSNPENLTNKENSPLKNEICINENGMFGEKEKQMKEKLANVKKISKWNENKVVEKLVGEISSCVTQQLWALAVHDARLMDELRLVKEIFLLGRGELFHEFVTQIDDYVRKGMSRNLDLNQILQESARKVLIKEESLNRFDIKFSKPLNAMKSEKSSGEWPRIVVKYDIPWPLQLLFTPTILSSYNSIFRFLLRLKRIQVKLVDCWLFEKSKRYREDSLKRRQLLRNLWFLINNLQYYLHVDVLDSQFMIFETAVENSKDFEEIQKAHLIFIENLISQLFIHNDTESDASVNPVYRSMNKIIELCEEYCHEAQTHGDLEIPEEKINILIIKFDGCVEFLLKLLTALTKQASHPCSQYLSQFLLRFDYNSYFSNQFSSNLMSAYV